MHQILVDGHVHFHACYSLPVFLNAALANLTRAAETMKVNSDARFVLLLGDEEEHPAFRRLLRAAESGVSADGWVLRGAAQRELVVAERGGARLFVLPGRQVRTRQNLELLALCTRRDYPDGLDLDESVAAVLETDAVGVLPWGFGKWTGERGRRIRRLIERPAGRHLLLGDSSARPAWLPEPEEFALAREAGMRILAGTDPFPFASQQQRVGAFGSCLEGELDEHALVASLKALLLNSSMRTFGQGERFVRFLKNQCAMQLRKSLRARPKGGS